MRSTWSDISLVKDSRFENVESRSARGLLISLKSAGEFDNEDRTDLG